MSSMLSEYDEAVKALEKAVKINPEHADAQFTLGNLYSELERYEEAADAYKKAVKIKPKFAEAHYNLGVVYIKLSKKMQALARKEYNTLRKLDKQLAKGLNDVISGKK
jgi:tetratricopeptide (TPR) repeat protein